MYRICSFLFKCNTNYDFPFADDTLILLEGDFFIRVRPEKVDSHVAFLQANVLALASER